MAEEADDFLRRRLLTDLSADPPMAGEENFGEGSVWGENSLGVGARKADLSTGFGVDCFGLGVGGSIRGVEGIDELNWVCGRGDFD